MTEDDATIWSSIFYIVHTKTEIPASDIEYGWIEFRSVIVLSRLEEILFESNVIPAELHCFICTYILVHYYHTCFEHFSWRNLASVVGCF